MPSPVDFIRQLLGIIKAPGVPPLPGRTSPPPPTKGAPWNGPEAQVRAAEAASDTVRPPADDGSPAARAQRLKRNIDALSSGPQNKKTAEKIQELRDALAATGESGENPVRVAEQRLAKARRDAALYRKPEYQGTGLADAAAREVEEAIEAYRQAVAAEQAARPGMPTSREQSEDIGQEGGPYRGKDRFKETVSREEAVVRATERRVLESPAYEQAGKLQGPTQFAAGLGDEAFDAGMPGKPRESITLGQQQRAAMRVDAREKGRAAYEQELVEGAIAKVRELFAAKREELELAANPNRNNDKAVAARAEERERVRQITDSTKRNRDLARIRQDIRGALSGGQGPRMADEPVAGNDLITAADRLDARILSARKKLEALAGAMSRGEAVDQRDIQWAAEKLNTLEGIRGSRAQMPRADLARRQNEIESVAVQLASAGVPAERAVEAAMEVLEAARLESTYVSTRGDRPVLGAGAGTADYPSATSAVGSPGSATPSSSPAPQPPQDRPLPRVEGPPGAGLVFVREEMARARDMADKAGLTRKIFDLSAQGLTAAEVALSLGEELGALARESDLKPAGLVRLVRNSLNIPSQLDPQEFAAWQKANGFGPGGAPSAAAADPTGASATSISGPEGESSTLLSVPVTPKASTLVDRILQKYIAPAAEPSQADLNRELEAGLRQTPTVEGPGADVAAQLDELNQVEQILSNPTLDRLLPPELRDAQGVSAESSKSLLEAQQAFIEAYATAAKSGGRAPLAPGPSDGPLARAVRKVKLELDLRGPAEQLHNLIIANSSVADGGYVLNDDAIVKIRRVLKGHSGGAVNDLARRLRDTGVDLPENATIEDVASATLSDFFRRVPRAEPTNTMPDATVGRGPEPRRTTPADLERVPAPDPADELVDGIELDGSGNPVLETRGRVFATPAGQAQPEPVPGPEPKAPKATKPLGARIAALKRQITGEAAQIEADSKPQALVPNSDMPRQGEPIEAPRRGTFFYPGGRRDQGVEVLVLEKRGDSSQTKKTVAERRFFRPLGDGRFLEYTIADSGRPVPAADAVPESFLHSLGNEGFVAADNRVKGARGTRSFRVLPPRQITEGEARAAGRFLFDWTKEGGNAADADRFLRVYEDIKASGNAAALEAFHEELGAAAPFAPGKAARLSGQQKASEELIELIREQVEAVRESNPEETAGPDGWKEVGAGPSGPPLRPARPTMPAELAFEETAPGIAAKKALAGWLRFNPDASEAAIAARLRNLEDFHVRKYINEVLQANGRKPLPEKRPFSAVDYMGPAVSDDQLVHALAALARIPADAVPRPRNELERAQNFIRIVEGYKNAPDEVLEEALLFAPGKSAAEQAADARFMGTKRPEGSPVSYFRKGDNTTAPLDPAQAAQNLREDATAATLRATAQKNARAAYDPNNQRGVFGRVDGAGPPTAAVTRAASQKDFNAAMQQAFAGGPVPLGLQARAEKRAQAGRVGPKDRRKEIADVLSEGVDDSADRARELIGLEKIMTSAGVNALASKLMAQAKQGGQRTTLSAAKSRARKMLDSAVRRMDAEDQGGAIDQELIDRVRQIQRGDVPGAAVDQELTGMLSELESPEQIAFAIHTTRRYVGAEMTGQGLSERHVSDVSAQEANALSWRRAAGIDVSEGNLRARDEQARAVESLFGGGGGAAENLRIAAKALFDAGITDRPDDYATVVRESMRNAGLTRLPGEVDGAGFDAEQADAMAEAIVGQVFAGQTALRSAGQTGYVDENATWEPKSADAARLAAMTPQERGELLMKEWGERLRRDNDADIERSAESMTFGYGPFRPADVRADIDRLRNLRETLQRLEASGDPSLDEGPKGRTQGDRIRALLSKLDRTELPNAEETLRSYEDASRAALTPEAASVGQMPKGKPNRPLFTSPRANVSDVAYSDPLVRPDEDFPGMPANAVRFLQQGAVAHVLDQKTARLLIEAQRGNVLAAADYAGRLQGELEAVQANIRDVEMDPSTSPAKQKRLDELRAAEQVIMQRLEAAGQERLPAGVGELGALEGRDEGFENFAGVDYNIGDGATTASASRRYVGGDTPQYNAQLRQARGAEDLEGLPEDLNVTAFIGPDIEYNHKAATDFLRAFSADDWDDVSDIEPNILQAAQELRSKVGSNNAGPGQMALIKRIMRKARVDADGGSLSVDPSQALDENFFKLLLNDPNVNKALSSVPVDRRMSHLIGLVSHAPLSTLEFNNQILDAARAMAPQYGATTMPELLASLAEHMGTQLPKGRTTLLGVFSGLPDRALAEFDDAATAARMQDALERASMSGEDAGMVPLPEPPIRRAAAPPAPAPAPAPSVAAQAAAPDPASRGRVSVPAPQRPRRPAAQPAAGAEAQQAARAAAPPSGGDPPPGPPSRIRKLARDLGVAGAGIVGAIGAGQLADYTLGEDEEGAPMRLPLPGDVGFGGLEQPAAGVAGAGSAGEASLALASAPEPDTNSAVAVLPEQERIAALVGRLNRASRGPQFPYATAQNPFPY